MTLHVLIIATGVVITCKQKLDKSRITNKKEIMCKITIIKKYIVTYFTR